MKWLTGLIFLPVLVVAALGIRQAVAENALETPEYQVTQKDGNYEFRTYPAYLVAEVSVSGDRSQAASAGFEILAGYIFGANRSRQAPDQPEKIAMTSPVTQLPQPDGQWKVRFMMPRRYRLETLPVAKDERIRFFSTQPERYLALRFSGSWDEENLTRHRIQLQEYAESHHIESKETPMYAFYNAPFVPAPLRRNEVLLRL
jgi:hypothetical protein